MSFLSELNRRNVFRVAIAYVVTAWLIAQVAELAAESFGAPAWVMKMIITMLALGAPVALVMAWAYELTPGGLRRDPGTATRQASAGKLDRFAGVPVDVPVQTKIIVLPIAAQQWAVVVPTDDVSLEEERRVLLRSCAL